MNLGWHLTSVAPVKWEPDTAVESVLIEPAQVIVEPTQPVAVAVEQPAQPTQTVAKEAHTTMGNPFKSVGHFLATVFTVVKNNEPKVEAGIQQVESTSGTVEAVTALVPTYGPMALTVEKAAYAVLGEIAAVLHAGDAASVAKLQDVGLDSSVISTVQDLLSNVKQYTALIK